MYNPQLLTFIRVADTGSFSKAAQELFISATAVTKQINLLEKRLGIKLFERSHRGLALTMAGKSLYQDALAVISLCNDAVARAKEITNSSTLLIRVGIHPMVSAEFLIRMLPSICRYNAKIRMECVSIEEVSAFENKLGGAFDIVPAIYWSEYAEEKNCLILPMGNVPVRLAVSITSPLAQKERLTLEDINNKEILIYREGYNKKIDEIRKQIRFMFEKNVRFTDLTRYNTFDTVKDKFEEGAMVVTIDYWENLHPMQKIMPVEWDLSVPIGLIYSRKADKRTMEFLEAVKQVLNEETEYK